MLSLRRTSTSPLLSVRLQPRPLRRRLCTLQEDQKVIHSKLVEKLTQFWPVLVQPFKGHERALFVAREEMPVGVTVIKFAAPWLDWLL